MTRHFRAEWTSQPDCWAAVVDRGEQWTGLLPARGEYVAAVGCGTSWFMAQAYAALREGTGHGPTDAVAASEFRLREYDRVVLISRSGTTTEVLQVMERLREHGIPHVGLVATPGTPLAEGAQAAVLLSHADEQSVVQTRFATTALALLRCSVGDDVGPAIAQARDIVAAEEQQLFDPALRAVDQITFLGTGWSTGLANEAALKLRESVQFWTESYPAMEYRHGPISIAAPGRAVWALGETPAGLPEEVARTGAHVEHRPGTDPMAELVRVHRYCQLRAAQAGLDVDHPRHLSRSVVLDG